MHRIDEPEFGADHHHDRDYKRMGQLLIEAGVITDDQLTEALRVQQTRHTRLVETLVSLNYMKPAAFVDFLARQPGVASIDLLNYTIPPEIIYLVPRELALKHEVFPIDRLGKLLTLGMACPLDAEAIRELEEVTGLRVKAMLCSTTDIRAAIQRYYPEKLAATNGEHWGEKNREGVGSAIKLHSAARLVRQMRSLPALPETVDSVRRLMLELSATPGDVLHVLHRDPAVIAKVLSVANSPAYGFPGHVNDLEKAVALMGLREVYAIVLSASYMDFAHTKLAFDYRRFWIDAMTCAELSKKAAELASHADPAGAYWAGYLHDVGRIVLLTVARDLYSTIPEGVEGTSLVQAEEELFGLAHTEAGFELAVDWNLPPDIAETIRFHHAPERATAAKKTVATVALAEALLRRSNGTTDKLDEQCVCCLNILKVPRTRRKAFVRDMGDVVACRRQWATRWETAFTEDPHKN